MNIILNQLFLDKKSKETFWATISKIISLISGAFFLYFIPNVYGIENYGNFSLFFSYIYLLIFFFGASIKGGITKEIAEYKFTNKGKRFFLEALKLVLIIIIFSSISFILITNFVSIPLLKSYKWHLLAFINLYVLWDLIVYTFQSAHRLVFVALIYLLEYFATILLLLIVLFVFNNTSFSILISVFFIGYFLSAIGGLTVLLRLFKELKFKDFLFIDKQLFKIITKRAFFIGLTGVSLVIFSKIDTVMISLLMNMEEVGYYSMGAELAKQASAFSIPIILGVTPLFVKKPINKLLFFSTIKKLLILNLAILAIIILFGNFIINLLFDGELEKVISVLYLLSAYPLIVGFQTFLQQILILRDKTKQIFLFSGVAVIINVVLNYLLTRFFGINGTAIATLISYMVWFMISLLYVYKYEFSKEDLLNRKTTFFRK